jgi:glycosyltransferase involved in cell wall biosynthesis
MRLMILQYAADYREAVQRFARGGSENYYAQRYSVEGVGELAQKLEEVSVLCCISKESYNEILDNGVRAIGAGFYESVDENKIIELIAQHNPTHLVLQTPLRKVLKWAIKNKIKVLVMLAESIVVQGWRDRWRSFKLTQLLNHRQVEWVGSYGITSSKLLQQLGVNSEKIVPWDFLIGSNPGSYPAKTFSPGSKPYKLLYVGSLSEAKGVGDILRAVAQLHQKRFPVKLQIVGKDTEGTFEKLAQDLEIAGIVEFLGMIPNSEVEPRMRAADAVLVASRPTYTEGFPLTIHHALCARTPIIASDHPMFVEHLKHRLNSVIYPAGNSTALASAITELFSDPALYEKLSQESYNTWYRLRVPVKWCDMIHRWTFSSNSNRQWLYANRLPACQKYLAEATFSHQRSVLLETK